MLDHVVRLFRTAAIIAASVMSAVGFVTGQQSNDDSSVNQRFVLVCSTTQVADFARQVCGDRWEVVGVLGPAEDPHTYDVGVDDSIAVQRADLCAENGWHLEGHDWMKKLATNASKPIVTCVDGVEPLMTRQGSESVKDPHAWFDPKNAAIYVRNICRAVCEIDPANKAEYELRAELYIQQLRVLAAWVKQTVNAIPPNRRILVTHHDAFGYFCRAFQFEAVSPVGWTTGELVDLSADQRQDVVQKIRELGVKAVFVETSVNQQLVAGIARDAGVSIGGSLYSDAMGPAGTAAETYIGMVRENVLAIVNALK
jgi:manganese/iron transport system substrate-binding protein